VHGVRDIRQTESHIDEPLLSYISPSSDQIPAELIQARGEMLHSEIHELTKSVWNKEELPQQWKEFLITHFFRRAKKTDCSSYRGISLLPTTYKILSNIFPSRLT